MTKRIPAKYDDPIDRAARRLLESCAVDLKYDLDASCWIWRDRKSIGRWDVAHPVMIRAEVIRAMRLTSLPITVENINLVANVAECYAADYLTEEA